MRAIFTIFSLLLVSLPAFSAQGGSNKRYFTHLSVEEGITQNTVWCILQDREGFMWFGTKDGLNRYDGQRFRTFRNETGNDHSLKCNFVRSLYEHADGRIWVGTLTGLYIYDPQTERFSAFVEQTPAGETITGEVNDIKADTRGDIWICVNWQGVFRYEPSKGKLALFAHEPGDPGSLSSPNPWSVCFDNDGEAWVGCHKGDLNRFDRAAGRFVRYHIGQGDIYKVVTDGHGQLLVGTSNQGVFLFNPYSGTSRPLLPGADHRNLFVRDICVTGNNEVWIATESGVYIYSYDERPPARLTQEFSDPYSLSGESVYSIYADRQGSLWVGTYFGGVNYLPQSSAFFKKYLPSKGGRDLSGKAVREFIEDAKGRIWIGTEDAGLNMFDPRTEEFRTFDHTNSPLPSDNIHGLLVSGDRLYVGTFNGGFCVMDTHTLRITATYSRENGCGLSDNNIFSICGDRDGRIWIGTIYGLNVFDPKTGKISVVRQIGESAYVYDILQADNGNLYFAVYNRGVFCFNPYSGQWSQVALGDQTARIRYPISLSQDRASNLWIGTEGTGLVRYVPSTGDHRIVTSGGLQSDDVVYKVLEDGKGYLWISTNKGLRYIDQTGESARTFTSNDGLPSNQFNYKSGFAASGGEFYFGTINGFVRFTPEEFKAHPNQAPMILTGFSFFNRPAEVGAQGSPLPRSIRYMETLKLSHDRSSFRIEFALLSYTASKYNRYRYRMQGYDEDWTHTVGNPAATYSNLPPGKYVFEVMGANSDGMWNDRPARLQIVIRPPFYRTMVAYALYVLLAGTLIWYYVRKYSFKMRQKSLHRLQEIQHNRERQEYRAKIDFFTNITHEIRTPVSLIKGPFEQITDPDISEAEYEENIQIMRTNIDRLLQLINQLLDFRKMESNHYSVCRSKVDMVALVRDCAARFAQGVKQKKLDLSLDFPRKSLYAWVDKEAFVKIVSNLLDNAVKFASGKVRIRMEEVPSPEGERLVISVSNDGAPIPVRFRESIFEPFFQINNGSRVGTGLGLLLVKNLVEMHSGRLYLDPDAEMTRFVVDIPRGSDPGTALEQAPAAPADAKPEEDKTAAAHPDKGGVKVLVVEDEPGMKAFLYNILSKQYQVYPAANADEVPAILDEHAIELIVTDVMMPGVSGIELCRSLKSNIDYSHIPVLILSARTDIDSKIAGLDAGADVYLEKPFSGNYLLAQMRSILHNRQMMKQTFLREPFAEVNSIAMDGADKDFFGRLNSIVEENIADENFSIDHLAAALNMSRSSLHRKMKGMLMMTPNDFIRLLRLKKAAKILAAGDYRVNEVCFMVGFNSPSYFAKCFLKQFGMLPKDFGKKKTESAD